MPLRVLHIPGRGPYVRKLRSPTFVPVNDDRETTVIPTDVSCRWLREYRPFEHFDVLHIHYVEFDVIEEVEAALDICERHERPVVFTAHDLVPTATRERVQHEAKLRMLCERTAVACLTRGSARELQGLVGDSGRTVEIALLPHGGVVDPDNPAFGRAGSPDIDVVYGIFGSLRSNRHLSATLLNFQYGVGRDATLRVLTRGVSPAALSEDSIRFFSLLQRAGDRVHLQVTPFPSDDEVIKFLLGCDALIMPYLWGTHSGQLEIAFDLGLLPIASQVGYLREQWEFHADVVPEPVWFDWSDDGIYLYGARQLGALLKARERVLDRHRDGFRIDQFREHRREEHRRILLGYSELYRGAS